MSLVSIIGILASIFTAASLLPQLFKLLKEKEAENISLGMTAILFAGLGLWIWYGIEKGDWIIIVANSFSFIINIILALFAIKYKKKI